MGAPHFVGCLDLYPTQAAKRGQLNVARTKGDNIFARDRRGMPKVCLLLFVSFFSSLASLAQNL